MDPHVRIRSGSSYGCAGAWRGAASQKGFHGMDPMGFQGNRFLFPYYEYWLIYIYIYHTHVYIYIYLKNCHQKSTKIIWVNIPVLWIRHGIWCRMGGYYDEALVFGCTFCRPHMDAVGMVSHGSRYVLNK